MGLLSHESYNPTTYTAVTNYSKPAVYRENIYFVAMQVGTYDWDGTPIKLYDCGTPYVPPPLTLEQIKAQQEAAKAAAQREYQRQFAAQSNAIVWLQPQATNGDASAQCSLGEHYLTRRGCSTNIALGVYWLQKSAAQGDIEASNKLASLKLYLNH